MTTLPAPRNAGKSQPCSAVGFCLLATELRLDILEYCTRPDLLSVSLANRELHELAEPPLCRILGLGYPYDSLRGSAVRAAFADPRRCAYVRTICGVEPQWVEWLEREDGKMRFPNVKSVTFASRHLSLRFANLLTRFERLRSVCAIGESLALSEVDGVRLDRVESFVLYAGLHRCSDICRSRSSLSVITRLCPNVVDLTVHALRCPLESRSVEALLSLQHLRHLRLRHTGVRISTDALSALAPVLTELHLSRPPLDHFPSQVAFPQLESFSAELGTSPSLLKSLVSAVRPGAPLERLRSLGLRSPAQYGSSPVTEGPVVAGVTVEDDWVQYLEGLEGEGEGEEGEKVGFVKGLEEVGFERVRRGSRYCVWERHLPQC